MSQQNNCLNCGNATTYSYSNYCNWGCHVEFAKKRCNKIITPNNLPIMCIKANGDMLEHEHADHPNYLFPVTVKYLGEINSEYESKYETHAVIFIDKARILTLFECSYHLWSTDGKLIHSNLYNEEYKIENDSLTKIYKFLLEKNI